MQIHLAEANKLVFNLYSLININLDYIRQGSVRIFLQIVNRLSYNLDKSPSIAPIASSQATKAAPNIPAITARIINQIAAPTLLTNLEVPAAKIPTISMAIPQKKAPNEYNG